MPNVVLSRGFAVPKFVFSLPRQMYALRSKLISLANKTSVSSTFHGSNGPHPFSADFRTMTTTKAIRVKQFGDPSVLQLEDNVILPALEPHQLLIRVKAAGVNPVETYIREGKYAVLPQLPYTPGSDAAGTVEIVGSGLTEQFKVGERVYTTKSAVTGTYAEKVIVNVASTDDEENAKEVGGTYSLPEQLSFEQGAAVGVPYYTAYRALMQICKAKPGETVLVHGASGAVGLAACQIALNLAGLIIIGTAGTEAGLETVRSAGGAQFVVNHRDAGYIEQIQKLVAEHTKTKQLDIVIEMLGNENITKDLEMIGLHGRIAVVGNRGPTQIDLRQVMMKEAAILGVALPRTSHSEWNEAAKAINDGLKNGLLKPVVDRTYRLNEAAQAHYDIIHSKGAKGKLVLVTDSDK